jgi:hypothetical protein
MISKIAKRGAKTAEEAEEIVKIGAKGGEIVDAAKKITSKLSPGKIKGYLTNVDQVPRESLIKDMESIGLKLKGQGSPDGRFMEFVDHQGRVRAKIHPPDGVTTTNHLHIYDSEGNSLNKVLEIVSKTSSDAHIPIQ